jgi:hypothetical protein
LRVLHRELDPEALAGLRIDACAARDANYRGKGVQLEFVVEDQKMFTMPWSASITYLKREQTGWEERICAENVEHDFNFGYFSDNAKLPSDDVPDF